MGQRSANPGIEILLQTLEQAFHAKAWHGSTLRGALSRVGAEEALWRPTPARHNIWEIAIHTAYWKYIALKRLSAEPPPPFPLPGSDWIPSPTALTQAAWKRDLGLLERAHRALLARVAELTDGDLPSHPRSSTTSTADLIRGVAFHDVYHCGQIQILKRMYRAGRRSSG